MKKKPCPKNGPAHDGRGRGRGVKGGKRKGLRKQLLIKNNMKKVLKALEGKKSYIGGAVIFIGGGLLALDVIDKEFFNAIAAIGAAISVGGLRSAIKNIVKK